MIDALKPLAEFGQFILWTLRDDKKLPIDWRSMNVASAHDPAIWLTGADAEKYASLYGPEYNIGYVFTDADPFFFLDIDHALKGYNWSNLAVEICTRLSGACVEVSQSGTGLHIFGRYSAPPAHSCKDVARGLELYTSGRFVALTGRDAVGSAGFDCTIALAGVIADYFPSKACEEAQEWTIEAVDGYLSTLSDEALIAKARKAQSAASAFGGKASFNDLWLGKIDAYGGDASSADAALAQHLAFWTGGNCDRILALMKLSGLVRTKWDRADYLPRTILKSCSLQESYFSVSTAQPVTTNNTPDSATLVSGFQYLGASQQIDHFKGCVYIQDQHKIFTPEGEILKPDQFNATYGGYVFQLDADGDKTTRKAWEAFTESQVVRYPKANGMAFRPELPAGEMIKQEGRTLVNVYVEIHTEKRDGDPQRFLDHLAKILPVPEDREILLSYMAACIQYKGVKFQWAPLLQGAEGNGKTLFTRCVAWAIGDRYVHQPPAQEIGEKYNAWLFSNLFIGVEDVYYPDQKKEIIEIIKPMITNDRLARRAMQTDQTMNDVRCNFLFNSNHKDAIRKTRNDRRFAVFYSAQQTKDDIERDGMGGDYFPKIYKWLKHAGGYAIVNKYLADYKIPAKFNPAEACHRAPETSSTTEAVTASMGAVEQEIIEAISEGRYGFAGGWASSVAIDRLLIQMRMGRAIPHNKRRELMRDLGYDWHPTLKDGRVNNIIPTEENKKPRLFIKEGHISKGLRNGAQVAEAYVKAQTDGGGSVAEKFKEEEVK
jgi:hypothetical protein